MQRGNYDIFFKQYQGKSPTPHKLQKEMVVGRVLRATGCPSCRVSIIRSFASLAGPPIRTPQISARLHYPTSCSSVRLSSNVAREDDGHDGTHESHGLNVTAEDAEEETKDNQESLEASAVPWYLQDSAPQKPPQPLSERQRIPDLPESPPPILQPLMQQISVDLGLDNLSLLDLRKLDPPPALGANLLMLIGTARSEKHLHVSADRLCRWLRSTYKLRPDADGLLGRNELKLKLRRKSRRAKLLGSAVDDNGDDGVRTGWVCVDVGVVEGAEPTTDAVPEPKGFVGFGRRTDGVRIVVQLLTQEKRDEIDLEKLWGGILKRGTQPEIEDSGEDDSIQPSGSTSIPAPMKRMDNAPSSILSQTRGFHTSARRLSRLSAHPETQSFVEVSSVSRSLPTFAKGSENFDLKDIQQSVMLSIASGNFNQAKTDLLRYSKDIASLQNEGWRPFLLKQLRAYLESIPRDQALEALGTGSYDRRSSPFLASFYQTLSAFPSEAEGEAIIWLYCYAMDLGHGGYAFKGLMDLLTELQLSGVAISSESYLRVVRSVLRPVQISEDHSVTPRRFAEGAMEILQMMHDQGHKVLTEETFLALQEATASESIQPAHRSELYTTSSETFDLPTLPMSALRRRIHVAMKAVDLPFFRDETRLRLLDMYSRQHHWLEFWDIWRMAPRQGKPQSSLMYAFMFNRVAETGNQKGCMTVLRTWIPDMDLENPKVLLEGDVAESVKAVLKVADPHVEREAASDPGATGEWIDLWRRCTMA